MRINLSPHCYQYIFVWLLHYIPPIFASFQRVETGHQNIAIDGRDPYDGYYTRIHFHDQPCVIGLHLHCLKQLTGAEEIDLLYSECDHGRWKVAHYTNAKAHFRLQKPILVKRLSISSRSSLTIIDVQVESCPNETLPVVTCHGHPRRHSKNEVQTWKMSFLRIQMTTISVLDDLRSNYIIVKSGENLTIEAGSIIEFESNTGIIVQANGTLHLNGNPEKPIVLLGPKDGIWRGITVQPEGRLSMKHTEIQDPAIGIWIDSDRVSIEGGRILRPLVHGIEVSRSSDEVVNFGGLIIDTAMGTAIEVDETNERESLRLENVQIINSAGTGIEFQVPSNEIDLRNIEIRNGAGYGIHIVEFPKSKAYYLNTVYLSNVSILSQSRGHAAIFIQGTSMANIIIEQSLFQRNTVPSLIIDLECVTPPNSTVRINNCRFRDNLDAVVYIMMGSCGNLNLRQNSFEQNNADGQKGVLSINTNDVPHMMLLKGANYSITENQFVNNTGEYTLHIAGSPGIGLFSGNILEENMNSQAVIMLETAAYNITENAIINPRSQYQVAIDRSVKEDVNLSNNDWGMDNEDDIKDLIDSGPAQMVQVLPVSQSFNFPSSAGPNQNPASLATPLPNPSDTTLITTKRSVNTGAQGCQYLNYCSGKGQCVDNICICNMGYIGFNCSIPIGCECSEHGVCDIFNRCNCLEGWTGKNCSTPICRNNCTNNGKCIDRNKCECNPGWKGEFCDEPYCHESTCDHGHCEGPNCVCDRDWIGSRCHIPKCSNCSLNGYCTAPERCSCFEGFGGKDCSICSLTSCQACDFDCDHGTCDSITKTCTCHNKWSGGACDLCPQGNCVQTSRVFYIQPSAAERQDVNAVVNVYGIEFPITNDHVYSCIYGATVIKGQRITSGLVRCPVPSNMTSGRHIFAIAPGSSQLSIETMDKNTIHFTFYDGCIESLCKGTCLGPQCLCQNGYSGINCEVIEISSVVRISSTIKDLNFDSSRGIIEWENPAGSETPETITATVYSPTGESQLSWNVTVKPSYSVTISNVTVENRVVTVTGNITRTGNLRKSPVVLKFQREGSSTADEIHLETEADGTFRYEFVPPDQGKYTVTASHPGTSPTERPYKFSVPKLNMDIGEESRSIHEGLRIIVHGQQQCSSELIRPKGAGLQNSPIDGGFLINHTFAQEYTDEVVATVKCDDEPMELVRVPPDEVQPQPSPRELAIFADEDELRSDIYKITLPTMSYGLTAPLNFELKPPLILLSSEPSIMEYDEFSKKDLILYLGVDKSVKERENGSLIIESAGQHVVTIPYTFVGMHQDYVNIRICARDEMDGLNTGQGALVSIGLTNLQLNTQVVQNDIKANIEWRDFTLRPGTYQLEARSVNHLPYSSIVEISPLNTSFCVPLTTFRTDAVPTLTDKDDKRISLMPMSKAELDLPYLLFEPSTLDGHSQSHRVKATVNGILPGTVGLWNNEVDGVKMEPSVRSARNNESFWVGFDGLPTELKSKNSECDAALVKVPYLFVPQSQSIAANAKASIVVQTKMGSRLCDENGNPLPLAVSTTVLCACGEGARARCRSQYVSATACGDAWKYISDDTVSLEVLAGFIRLAAQCKIVNVKMEELRKALECIASIESECPIARSMRSKRDPEMRQSDDSIEGEPRNITKRQSEIFKDLPSIASMSSVLPVFNALDIQSIKLATYYIDFIDKLEVIAPSSKLSEVDRHWLDSFSRAIGDNSAWGKKISPDEMKNLGSGLDIAHIWDATVGDWSSGKIDGAVRKEGGVGYEDMKNLVLAADKLKNFARQVCATASIMVQPSVVEEGGEIVAISAFVENQKNEPLTGLTLTVDFVRSDPISPVIEFQIGNSQASGIENIDGFGVLNPRSAFEAHWTRSPLPIIVMSFNHNGKSNVQKLKASSVTLRPKKILRAMILIPLAEVVKKPFSMLTSIINPGYTNLEKVVVDYTAFEFRTGPGKYHLEEISVDGDDKGKSLSIDMGQLKSGASKMIKVILHDNEEGLVVPVFSAKLQAIVEGKLQPFESVETYEIKAAPSEDEFLLSLPGLSVPLFFFRPSSGSLVNIIQITYKTHQPFNTTSPTAKTYAVAFKNDESPDRNGAVMGSFTVPNDVPENYTLSKMIEVRGNTRTVQPLFWFDQTEEGRTLHFIDPGVALPNPQLTYEIFFDSADEANKAPVFRQSEYRIQIMPNDWPLRDTVIGTINAEGQDLQYHLYAPDNEPRFMIDKDTGNIYIESSEVAGEEYCLVLEAVDREGRTTQVPVAINTGGDRKSCILFNTEGKTPLAHSGGTNIFPSTQEPSEGSSEGSEQTHSATSDANWPPITGTGSEIGTTTHDLVATHESTHAPMTTEEEWSGGASSVSSSSGPIQEPSTEETHNTHIIGSEGTMPPVSTHSGPGHVTSSPIEVSTPLETEYTLSTINVEPSEHTGEIITMTPNSQITHLTTTPSEETMETETEAQVSTITSDSGTLLPVDPWRSSTQSGQTNTRKPITRPLTPPITVPFTPIEPFTDSPTPITDHVSLITKNPDGSNPDTREPVETEDTHVYSLPTDSGFETATNEPDHQFTTEPWRTSSPGSTLPSPVLPTDETREQTFGTTNVGTSDLVSIIPADRTSTNGETTFTGGSDTRTTEEELSTKPWSDSPYTLAYPGSLVDFMRQGELVKEYGKSYATLKQVMKYTAFVKEYFGSPPEDDEGRLPLCKYWFDINRVKSSITGLPKITLKAEAPREEDYADIIPDFFPNIMSLNPVTREQYSELISMMLAHENKKISHSPYLYVAAAAFLRSEGRPNDAYECYQAGLMILEEKWLAKTPEKYQMVKMAITLNAITLLYREKQHDTAKELIEKLVAEDKGESTCLSAMVLANLADCVLVTTPENTYYLHMDLKEDEHVRPVYDPRHSTSFEPAVKLYRKAMETLKKVPKSDKTEVFDLLFESFDVKITLLDCYIALTNVLENQKENLDSLVSEKLHYNEVFDRQLKVEEAIGELMAPQSIRENLKLTYEAQKYGWNQYRKCVTTFGKRFPKSNNPNSIMHTIYCKVKRWNDYEESLLPARRATLRSRPPLNDTVWRVAEVFTRDKTFEKRVEALTGSGATQPHFPKKYPLHNNNDQSNNVWRRVDWPNAVDCQSAATNDLFKRSNFPQLFPSPENKGYMISDFLTTFLGLEISEEHPLPWYEPRCDHVGAEHYSQFMIFKSYESIFKINQAAKKYSEPRLKTILVRLAGRLMDESEVGQRIFTAMKYKIKPRWVMLNLAALYWRVQGNPKQAMLCLADAIVDNVSRNCHLES
ncbi:hypothetical protein WR25_01780 [Diploscapter pachys]|uniref:EGF-like domain-containing protein n=1 Tax=Diploscapter pachys TaxID=2018661 RepID=A0A2A2JIA5_9BILA|nr:hypothetical protein WR25_01780 [Diploscapter pachys]